MVEFTIKINPEQGTAYIPKEIREALGHFLKARANLKAVIIYPVETDPKGLKRSLETLLSDIEHQIDIENKEASNNG